MDDDEPPSRRAALFALLGVAGLAAAGWWISRVLRDAGRTEDCLMRGGRTCAPLEAGQTR